MRQAGLAPRPGGSGVEHAVIARGEKCIQAACRFCGEGWSGLAAPRTFQLRWPSLDSQRATSPPGDLAAVAEQNQVGAANGQ